MTAAGRPGPAQARFITFEGGEGAGKSTQIKLLAEKLRDNDIDCTLTREPGGSPGAEIVRHLVLSGMGKMLGAEAETLLFAAAREDHVRSVIRPALDQGRWVLCDRFTDSTRVYQGKLGHVDLKLIRAMERVTIDGLQPDLTIVLDLPPEKGLARAAERRGGDQPDRFEAETIDFHHRLREAFRQVAMDEPNRCALIDADADVDTIAARVWTKVEGRFGPLARAELLETNGA